MRSTMHVAPSAFEQNYEQPIDERWPLPHSAMLVVASSGALWALMIGVFRLLFG